MNSKKSILNMGKIVILVVAAIMITAISTKAATAGWPLRYTKGAPSSDVITSKTVSGTMSSTKVVSAVISSFSYSGNGWVYVQSSSGGLSVFLNTCKSVDSPDKVKKGTSVTGRAAITNPSILNSLYSSGYFTF